MSLLSASLKQAKSAPSGAAETAQMEGAKAGAAAERKRLEQDAKSYDAWSKSAAANGRGVTWHRRIRANGEVRHVAMVERDGAYSERAFLAACRNAAAKATKGRLRGNDLAIEAIAADLCLEILAKTAGRMPKRGTLGRLAAAGEADAAYLCRLARNLIADAENGKRERIGLAAEISPVAASENATYAADADLLADAASQAEGDADPYMSGTADPDAAPVATWADADWQDAAEWATLASEPLTHRAMGAARAVAACCDSRPAAVTCAVLSALRPAETAADLASGMRVAKSAAAFRKNASLGRAILRDRISALPTETKALADADWRCLESLARLSAAETADRPADDLLRNGSRKQHAADLVDYRSDAYGPIISDYWLDAKGDRVWFHRDDAGAIVIDPPEG